MFWPQLNNTPKRSRSNRFNAIVAFWMAYILTRPLGASLGDLLTQARTAGGFGLGAMVTSAIFLTAFLASVIYLTIKSKSETETPAAAAAE
jgi:uncharacterized membrane-anchored protein